MHEQTMYRVACDGCDHFAVGGGYVSSSDLAQEEAVEAGFKNAVVDDVLVWYCPDCKRPDAPVVPATHDELLVAADDVVKMMDLGGVDSVSMNTDGWAKIDALAEAIRKAKGVAVEAAVFAGLKKLDAAIEKAKGGTT